MKKLLIAVLVLVIVVVVAFFFLGKKSKSGSPLGLANGQLAKCPDKPNCVCSEFADDGDHYIKPLALGDMDPDSALNALRTAIRDMGGAMGEQEGGYMSATFTSATFGFVDDLELRLDDNQIHVRSASRVGYSDRGVNKARVEQLRAAFKTP